MQRGVVVWITGLPNSGKTTVSRLLENRLYSMGYQVERLDSDEVPRSLTKDLSPDWTTRQRQKCTNLIFITKLLYKYNAIVLISSVGRFKEMRDMARGEFSNYVEVYLKCPKETRLQRDEKKKYQRYPDTINYYEETASPELRIETNLYTPEESVNKIMSYLVSNGYIDNK